MAKNKKDTQKVTMDALLQELQYLIDEGFVVYNPEDETYRMKTDDEIEMEIKKVR
jgi:hypothetical protein